MLTRGVCWLDRFLHDEPLPQKIAVFEKERSTLWGEIGHRIMAGVSHDVEPENKAETLSRL
jgi:hypothetical protein